MKRRELHGRALCAIAALLRSGHRVAGERGGRHQQGQDHPPRGRHPDRRRLRHLRTAGRPTTFSQPFPASPRSSWSNTAGRIGHQGRHLSPRHRTEGRHGHRHLQQIDAGLSKALGHTGAQFKTPKEMSWIGSLAQTADVLAVWHTTGVRTIADARQRVIVIGADSTGGTMSAYPSTAQRHHRNEVPRSWGSDIPAQSTVDLAMEKGEVDGRGSNP